MGKDLILTINPGTTTTRIGLFEPQGPEVIAVLDQTIEHDETRMAQFPDIAAQLPFRAEAVQDFLDAIPGGVRLAAVAGRGGMLSPVPAGAIAVNAELVDFALHRPLHHHASNLGAPLAHRIAGAAGCPAFIVDPVSVDELPPVARVSGCPELPRFSFVHALNIRACGRRLAASLGKPFEQINAVVAHMGAGISIAALKGGRIVDSSNRMENSPFSPERAGGLPPMPLIDLCYSGTYSQAELKRRLYGQGGVFAYLGTKDMRRVEAMIAEGDEKARLVWEAMVYQIGKTIGAMAAVLDFRPDAIILTGGMAHSGSIVAALTQRCATLAPLVLYPGSHESAALAEGALRALSGAEPARNWPVSSEVEPLPW
ncbi:butyrate kinase [Tabrizicola oligotrophica]|uniref:Probable butyrate kinase n=1 Tax=Tabrizicola oligotrophica TaxID=2710650 RepID=A0A6M0QPT4_9RHOB|nr:butyrate kinase [Tabrizicola oligotrophica]NEY89485.1 butyrate kinase [Tabrizicola oligotrophica]